MSRTIEFVVHGKPEPAGSKKGFPFKRKTGGIGVSIVDANSKAKPWKAVVAAAARDVCRLGLMSGPLKAEFVFYLSRPKSHYRSGRYSHLLKDSAPKYPITRPDVLKLCRAAEDAMTGVIYEDDAQIVREYLAKDYGEPRCEITITEL